MLEAVLLRFMQISEQGPRRAGGIFPVIQSEGCQLCQTEMTAKRFRCLFRLEPALRLTAHGMDFFPNHSFQRGHVVADHFHR